MSRRHTAFQRHSRSLLLWAGAVLVLGQFVGGLLLDHVWPLIRFPDAARVLAQLEECEAPPDLVFLGSSRFGCCFDADEVSRRLSDLPGGALNPSIPYGDSISSEFVLDRLLARGVRPATVVLEVTPETLTRPNRFLRFHVVRQLTWKDVPGYLVDAVQANAGGQLLSSRLIPLVVHRQELRKHLWQTMRKWVGPAERGEPGRRVRRRAARPVTPGDPPDRIWFASDEERFAEQRRTAAELVRRWLRDYRLEGNSPAALERVMTRCQRLGIDVVLLVPPLSSAHRAEYTSEIESAFEDHVSRLTRVFGCRFIDARDWMGDDQFVDCYHLDPGPGRRRFSRLFTERAVRPLVRLP